MDFYAGIILACCVATFVFTFTYVNCVRQRNRWTDLCEFFFILKFNFEINFVSVERIEAANAAELNRQQNSNATRQTVQLPLPKRVNPHDVPPSYDEVVINVRNIESSQQPPTYAATVR